VAQSNTRFILAVGLLIVGVVVAFNALRQTLPAPSAFDDPNNFVDNTTPFESDHPYFTPAAAMVFDIKPSPDNLSSIKKRAEQAVMQSVQQELSLAQALSSSMLEALALRFSEHLLIVLRCDYNDWVDFVESVGGGYESDNPTSRERYETAGCGYKMAPLSFETMAIRPQ